MDAVKEVLLEQKIDDLSARFDRADARFERFEERNREEHGEIRGEIRELRVDTNGALRDLNRTIIFGFASIVAGVFGGIAAAVIANVV
jgi:hypothetical protein